MPALLRRMLRIGNLPAELREQVEAEKILALGENLAVVGRLRGSVPGSSASDDTWRTAGAFALTSQRVVATLAVRSDPAVPAANRRWDATDPAPMRIEVARDGLTLDVNLGAVNPGFRGQLSLHYRCVVPDAALARLPARTVGADVSTQFVYQAVGVRAPG